jgi:hypothetical protein
MEFGVVLEPLRRRGIGFHPFEERLHPGEFGAADVGHCESDEQRLDGFAQFIEFLEFRDRHPANHRGGAAEVDQPFAC